MSDVLDYSADLACAGTGWEDGERIAVSDPAVSVHHTASTGDAMRDDQQGIPCEHSRGTAWYAHVYFSYGHS